MNADILLEAEKARARLQLAIKGIEGALPSPADVIITPYEVNELHGSGILLQRIFRDSRSIISIRSQNAYSGRNLFGAVRLCLPRKGAARDEIFSAVLHWLRGAYVRRVLCAPYLPEDPIAAIAVKELFNVPLCTYIMDDHNVCASGISDSAMRELLAKSSLRLAISPEMRAGYEQKYGLKFWLLPPLVPPELVRSESTAPPENAERRGVLVGNIWSQRWLERLQSAFKTTGYQLDWYCNTSAPAALDLNRAELEKHGIRMHESLPEADLAAALRRYAFAVVPSGTLDEQSTPSVQAIARLSLPSRIPFLLATAHLPILVLGDPLTAAARCIQRFGLGAVCSYEPAAITAALDGLVNPSTQTAIRRKAAAISGEFTAAGSADWIWRSLAAGGPYDLKYERLMEAECDAPNSGSTEGRGGGVPAQPLS